MPYTQIEGYLKRSSLFTNLDDRTIAILADTALLKNFSPRETIFSEGEPCHGFYLVAEGAVKVYKLSADGREHVLHLVSPGETFAEAALFMGSDFPAYAESIRATKAVLFEKQRFLNLIQHHPEIALSLMGAMSIWLRRMVSQVETLTLKDSAARLCQYLLTRNENCVVSLEAPKAAVASHLGMTPETLSRLFFRLEAAGAISVKGRTIKLANTAMIASIAAGDSQI